ncbi:ATP synthase subunit I [Sporolituus thermophilus]|uniref:ATP synthase I chain n=1 Tax=Sporolituus thermophilus DSM 23256 TaxID=1123285 RepID=A0A1G7HHB7_9FIRM|nr:ATP synthase subunit I [Sporolituus thermophilus]SDE99726.1 ATP synthase I chain [Sporolituus thermophilus DSM 23256]
MREYAIEARRTLLQIAALALSAIGCALLAGRADWARGLAFGSVVSAIYFCLLCYRVRRSAEMPAAKAVAYMRSGWLVRLVFISLALVLALKLTTVNFLAAVTGLFSLHIVIFLNAAVLVAKEMLSSNRQYARKG